MLDSRGNNKDGGWGINEKRGGFQYIPPIGWTGFGLRVLDRYDDGDNTWLDYKNLEGEWAVAYHGVGSSSNGVQIVKQGNNISLNNLQTGIRQLFKNSNDYFHPGKQVGEGVYLSPKPSVIEKYSGKKIDRQSRRPIRVYNPSGVISWASSPLLWRTFGRTQKKEAATELSIAAKNKDIWQIK